MHRSMGVLDAKGPVYNKLETYSVRLEHIPARRLWWSYHSVGRLETDPPAPRSCSHARLHFMKVLMSLNMMPLMPQFRHYILKPL
ncbi:hypothetical protein HYQ46_006063 [Verticillium longisporum]|nr:hypothetical protein HYQ46_006063 [Verticillium longisporum]